jgi:hypothetical protein
MIGKSGIGRTASALSFVLATSGLASAQSSNNQIAAESLFRDARRLLDEGKFAEACEKLASSERLDPAVGTLLNLGRCYEKTGQVASAWGAYREAVSMAKATGQADRAKTARAAADALEPTLPRLTITASPSATDVRVTRDGTAVSADLWQVAVPVDPGEHAIAASAPGKKPWNTTVTVMLRDAKTVAVPELEQDPTQAAAAPAVSATSSIRVGDLPNPAADQPAPGFWNTQRVIGTALVGVGIGGVILGVVEGLKMNDKQDESKKLCDGACVIQTSADEERFNRSRSLLDEARSARTLMLVGSIAGGAALVGGVVLFATAGSGSSPSARIELTPVAGFSDVGFRVNGVF